ncbi:MAG: hypothetical protein ABII27_02730 [bacterium]
MKKEIFCLIILLFTVNSCVHRVAVRKDYNFSAIKRIAILPFKGEGLIGEAVADEFKRQLLLTGIDVVEISVNGADLADNIKDFNVDAYITGTVARYKPEQNFLIYSQKSSESDTIVVGSPVIELGSDKIFQRRNISDEDDSYLLFTNASLTVNSRIIEVEEGKIVWANAYNYEGLDVDSSIGYIIKYFISSMKPYWRELNQ